MFHMKVYILQQVWEYSGFKIIWSCLIYICLIVLNESILSSHLDPIYRFSPQVILILGCICTGRRGVDSGVLNINTSILANHLLMQRKQLITAWGLKLKHMLDLGVFPSLSDRDASETPRFIKTGNSLFLF